MRVALERALSESLIVEVHKRVLPYAAYDPASGVVVLDMSKDWFLARSLDDGVEPDGYQVTRRDIVKTLQTSKFFAFRKGELQATGVWSGIVKKPKIDLTGTPAILDSLRRLRLFAIVLRETKDEWHSTHCRIESVSTDSVTLRGFDGMGQWQKRLQTVDIDDITHIRFGSHYLAFYQRYIERRGET